VEVLNGGVDGLLVSPGARGFLFVLTLLVFFYDFLHQALRGRFVEHHGFGEGAAAAAAVVAATVAPSGPAAGQQGGQRPPFAARGSNAACIASQLELGRAGSLLQASLTPRCAAPRPLAIAVPVYPPHFPYILNYLEPLTRGEDLGWDLFPVFSNEAEAEAFRTFLIANGTLELHAPHFTPLILTWDPLVMPRVAAVTSWGFGASYVLYKNYHALALLHPCYEYIAVLDAELKMLRPGSLVAAFSQRASAGIVFSGFVPRYRYFNLWSTCMFSPEDRAHLAELTRDNCLYSWWSDVPVYIASDVRQFLAYIGYPVHFGDPHGNEFAHLAYEQWKVMREEWRAVDLSDFPGYETCGSLEMMRNAEDYLAVRAAYPPGPRWLSWAFCTLHPSLCEGNEDIVLTFHLNRGVELLELAATQSCEALPFNRDPFDSPASHRQGCLWWNYTRTDIPKPIFAERQ